MVWTFAELIINMWAMFKYIIAMYASTLAVHMFLRAAR